jgi:hypothetical protein
MRTFSDVLQTIRVNYPNLFAEAALRPPADEDLTVAVVDIEVPRQEDFARQSAAHPAGCRPGWPSGADSCLQACRNTCSGTGPCHPGCRSVCSRCRQRWRSSCPRIPDLWVRVVPGPHVLLLDRRTQQILDIPQNVLAVP